MAQTVNLWGATYSNVPALTVPGGNGTALFADPSITTAIASDVAQGKQFLLADGSIGTGSASGGGGSDRLVLLKTTALGALSTSSTSGEDTGKSLQMTRAEYGEYDLLIVDCSVDTPTNNRHTSTVSFIVLTGSSNVATKNGADIISNKWNSKLSSSGTATTKQGSSYGVYVNSVSQESTSPYYITMYFYMKYSSSYSKTINGTYTARVYGIKLIDLIGG